jgi:hypothetical protein
MGIRRGQKTTQLNDPSICGPNLESDMHLGALLYGTPYVQPGVHGPRLDQFSPEPRFESGPRSLLLHASANP